MDARYSFNGKAHCIAALRASLEAAPPPVHAVQARSIALLSLVVAVLEGKWDQPPKRPAQ